MTRVTLYLILFTVSLSAWAEPYRLNETKRGPGERENEIVIEYEIEGSPFRMIDSVEGLGMAVEVHYASIHRGNEPKRAAYSEIWFFKERDGRVSASLRGYKKFDVSPEAKGLGTLVLHPLLDNKKVTEVHADLAYSNYSRMANELEARGAELTSNQFNDVVLTHSHLGKVLAANGFVVKGEETQKLPFRSQVGFHFQKPEHVTVCSWLLGKFGRALAFLRRPQ